jgi:hypothetical protein
MLFDEFAILSKQMQALERFVQHFVGFINCTIRLDINWLLGSSPVWEAKSGLAIQDILLPLRNQEIQYRVRKGPPLGPTATRPIKSNS